MDSPTFSAGRLDRETLGIFADALADPCLLLDRRSIVVHRNGAAASQFSGAVVGQPIAFSLRHPVLLAAIEASTLR